MRYEFRLPELGDDAPDKAKLSFWYKEEGEEVEREEPICEMFTDKATFDVPSPVSGTLLEIPVLWESFAPFAFMLKPPGAFVALGVLLAFMNLISQIQARKG